MEPVYSIPMMGAGSNAWPLANYMNIGLASFAELSEALLTILSGEELIIGEGTFDCNLLDFSKSIIMTGSGVDVSTLVNTNGATSRTLQISGSNTIWMQNLSIYIASSSSGPRALTVLTGHSPTLFLRNVKARSLNTVNDSGGTAFELRGTCFLHNCEAEGVAQNGTDRFALNTITGTTTIVGGYFKGKVNVNTGATLILDGPVITGVVSASGTLSGWYIDANGNPVVVSNVRRIKTDGFIVHETSFATAVGNLASGEVLLVYDDHTLTTGSGGLEVTASNVTIKGVGRPTITSAVADVFTLDVRGDNVTIEGIILDWSGTGSGGPLGGDGDNLRLINSVLTKTSGAATLSTGIWQYAGSGWLISSCDVIVSSGSNMYGYYNSLAEASATIFGGSIRGDTADIFGNVAESHLVTHGTRLANNLINYAGNYPRADIQPVPTAPIVMNGHPLIWQRGTSFAAAANNQVFADRFRYNKIGAMVHTLSRDTDVPTVAQIGTLLDYSMLIDCTTVDSSIASGDVCAFNHPIEGYDFLKIAQQEFTFDFWVKATKTGIYCVSFKNGGSDRTYVVEYTVNASDVWEYKQMTIPASPSAGTWNYINGGGLYISWALAAGSTWQTTANAWQTGNFVATANQVNACDNVANNFRLVVGDVTLGAYARPIVANPYGNIANLLAQCQRYYAKSYDYSVVPGTVTSIGLLSFQTRTAIAGSVAGTLRYGTRFPSRMRTIPTGTLYSNATGTSGAVRNASAANDRTGATMETATLGESGFPHITISNASANAIALDELIAFHYTADAEI